MEEEDEVEMEVEEEEEEEVEEKEADASLFVPNLFFAAYKSLEEAQKMSRCHTMARYSVECVGMYLTSN